MSNSTSTLRVTGLVKAYAGHADRPAVNGVDFEIEEGHFFTLLGPSGCGKTTTLRCVAGLERPTVGTVLVDSAVMSDGSSRRFVAPHRRPMGMVFQNYAIWPHLSVFDNVAFPLKTSRPRLTRSEIHRRVEEALSVVQLADFMGRPATLMSGGQQQRLSLARALVREPKILLLDEPLSNLDAKLRDAMRAELRSLQRRIGITTLYVTHDQAEALSMSNRIAVMSGGRMVQVGSPKDIYTAPKTRFVADFIGEANFLTGTIAERPDPGTALITTPIGSLLTGCPADAVVGDAVTVSIRPQDFEPSTEGTTAANTVRMSVEQALYVGEHYDYRMVADGVELAVRLSANRPRLRRGESITLHVAAERISVFGDRASYALMPTRDDEDPPQDGAADNVVGATVGEAR